jgi:hypothetical protein
MWPWKVPKWPLFWAEVAVKARRGLATLKKGDIVLQTTKDTDRQTDRLDNTGAHWGYSINLKACKFKTLFCKGSKIC